MMKNMRWGNLLFIVAFLIFAGCNQLSTKDTVSELYSKTIQLPQNMVETFNGRDSSILSGNTPLKLVVYYDSIGCISCSIAKMAVWNKYINLANESRNKFSVTFIMFPKNSTDEKRLKYTLKLNPIDYPVFIDKKGEFEKLNPQIPKDHRYHTLMIDSSGTVLMVGNPTTNEKVEKLFFKTVTSEMVK